MQLHREVSAFFVFWSLFKPNKYLGNIYDTQIKWDSVTKASATKEWAQKFAEFQKSHFVVTKMCVGLPFILLQNYSRSSTNDFGQTKRFSAVTSKGIQVQFDVDNKKKTVIKNKLSCIWCNFEWVKNCFIVFRVLFNWMRNNLIIQRKMNHFIQERSKRNWVHLISC